MKGDFLGFSFDGIHCSQLGITHVSSSDRYSEDLFPEVKDKTIEIPNNHGEYYYGSTYGTRSFSIDIAFDSITETQLRNIRRLFGTRKICELIFDERPYKVYYAKIENPIEMSYVCFDEEEWTWETEGHENYIPGSVDHKVRTGNVRRIYKGDGTVNLVCYQPFAHQLFKIKELYERAGKNQGNLVTTYSNVDEWIESSGILTEQEWNTYHIDQVIYVGGTQTITDTITIPAAEEGQSITFSYYFVSTPMNTPSVTGTNNYTINEDEIIFTNNTTVSVSDVIISYVIGDESTPYTYTIPVYNPGDLDVGFCLYIPFTNGRILPKAGKSDIIINGDTEILVLKQIEQKSTYDTGILINTRTHLIEGVNFSQIANVNDYRTPAWTTTGTLYNDYIKIGEFPYIKRNDWKLDTIDNRPQVIYISCARTEGIQIYYDYLYF